MSRLVCQLDQICLGLPGETNIGPIFVAKATTFAVGAESNRLPAYLFIYLFNADNSNQASHTKSKSLCSTRLNHKGEYGNQRKQAVGHDEVNNVIQGLAMQVYCERRT